MKKSFFYSILVLLLGGMTLVLMELSCHFLLTHPTLLTFMGKTFRSHFARYYENHHRNIIHNREGSVAWDPELAYRLRPGEFYFSNIEFSNRYYVNSSGFRDDERSLRHPEIIVIGDSLAMGWGVDQEESFPSVLEQESGLRVLNTAISSYSTEREFRALEIVDRSHLKYLVISYCSNDAYENHQIPPDVRFTESWFVNQTSWEATRVNYYLGKYTRYLVTPVLGALFSEMSLVFDEGFSLVELKTPGALNKPHLRWEAEGFLKVLNRNKEVIDSSVTIFLVGFQKTNPESGIIFDGELSKLKGWEEWKNQVVLVPFKANEEEAYILDTHLRAGAHRRLGQRLAKEVLKRENNRKVPAGIFSPKGAPSLALEKH